MEFAFKFCRGRILAVTGTNGKTTTTELLRALVAACGHDVVLGGNNALPFSAAVMLEPAPEYLVLEVSSYQLETTRSFRPWIATVLNVTPDHLTRHGSLDDYAAVKARLFANQASGDSAVLNCDDARVRGMATPPGVARHSFSLCGSVEWGVWFDGNSFLAKGEVIARKTDTRLRGRHNYENICAALAMMRAGGFARDGTLHGLRAFPGVEHRIEPVATIDGVTFYNDSKSTNIDSLRVALESFDVPIILIAGGRGKGSDYRVLRELMGRRVKKLIAIGEDAPLLEAAFAGVVATERGDDMNDAVLRAASSAAPGDAVLLSPACASFDMFDTFEHRGRVFKECVRKCREGSPR
jgi:UDP-N-acetylmuramoylalanine--D-glutamate ligase